MKHPLFASLGDKYPYHLEAQFERILVKIEELWHTPGIDDYFSDLLIDKRGGRKGFPKEVLQDILNLRDLRESEDLTAVETKEDAIYELQLNRFQMNREDFLRALDEGKQEIIDLYVRAGFHIHFYDSTGATPLLAALKKGYTVVARILLNAGSDINARDQLGLTPLILACTRNSPGHMNIALSLIRKGAFINMRDRLGNTPLLLAISSGLLPVAEELVERGVDIHASNRKGENAMTLLARLPNHTKTRLYQLLSERLEPPTGTPPAA